MSIVSVREKGLSCCVFLLASLRSTVTGAEGIRLSQRKPLALCEVPVAGPHRVTADALGRDALAAPALGRVVNAQHDRPGRRKGLG